jgi:hypothetical protein
MTRQKFSAINEDFVRIPILNRKEKYSQNLAKMNVTVMSNNDNKIANQSKATFTTRFPGFQCYWEIWLENSKNSLTKKIEFKFRLSFFCIISIFFSGCFFIIKIWNFIEKAQKLDFNPCARVELSFKLQIYEFFKNQFPTDFFKAEKRAKDIKNLCRKLKTPILHKFQSIYKMF